MQKLLTENNSHIFICGQTRSGKTYFAAHGLAQLRRPVIFFNLQEETLPSCFMRVDSENTTGDQIIEALRDGMKIDLRLPERSLQMNKVIGYLIDRLMAAGFTENRPIYLAMDECHIYKKEGLEGGIQVATRGLKRGCRCIFITQRPALASKTLYTQASEQYIFYLAPSEKEYIKNKGLDYDECMKYWEKLGDYSYIFYDGFKLEGRRAI